jgi:hypothetical protein
MLNYEMFNGKTIASVDNIAVNQLVFFFTDKTVAVIDTEYKGHGLYGPELIAFGNKKEVENKIGYAL